MANLYCLFDHHLVATIMGNRRNWVRGVVKPRLTPRAAMAGTLAIDGNDIPSIDKEAKR
jgi:hypothetical protein